MPSTSCSNPPVDTTELQENEIRLLRQIERGENPETGNGPETRRECGACCWMKSVRLKTRGNRP